MSGIDDCLDQAMTIPGALSVTLIDYASGLPIATAGGDDLDADEDAVGTADLVRAVLSSPALSAAQTGDDIQDIIVTGTTGTMYSRWPGPRPTATCSCTCCSTRNAATSPRPDPG